MQVRPLKSLFWLSAAVLLVVIGYFTVATWGGDATDAVANSKQEQAPLRDGGVGNERAVATQDGLALPSVSQLASQVRADSQRASDPRVWRSERTLFLSDKGFAASIQRALSDPSAARLFYALQAVDRCSNLRALGALDGGSATGRGVPAFAAVVATCNEALMLNSSQPDFFAKLRAARLGPPDQSILDAVDGKRSAQGGPIAQRFATVAPTDDPLLLAEVGLAWLRSRDASYAGAPLSDDSKRIFYQAWALAACEATSSCETSVGSFRICSTQQLCDGPLRSRLQSVLPKGDYETLIAYANAVASALRSKDFSAFN